MAVTDQIIPVAISATKRKRTKLDMDIDDTGSGPISNPVPKRRSRRSKKCETLEADKAAVVVANDVEATAEPVTRPRRRKAAVKATAAISTVSTAEEAGVVDQKNTDVTEDSPKKRKRRRRTPEEERVYEIEPISETLQTTFKGRLGYACLNTVLRGRNPPVFCSRTCRLATLKAYDEAKDDQGKLINEPFIVDGMNPHPHIRGLALQNVRDLVTLVRWNAENGIHFMRVSSDMFPFASHKELGYSLEFANDELREAGRVAKELGCRLTTHPGQFTQLGSPRENVVEAAVRDLKRE